MRVYMMCVGKRDPYWVDEGGRTITFNKLIELRGENYDNGDLKMGPILSFLSKFKPDINDKIYLLSTAEGEWVREPTMRGGEETAKKIEEFYKLERGKNIFHWPLSGVDPSDLGEVIVPMKEKVIDIMR